jgi:hypothetical protein
MHYIQLGLVVVIICLTGARIATKPKSMPVSRGDTLAIVMVQAILIPTLCNIYLTICCEYRASKHWWCYLINL